MSKERIGESIDLLSRYRASQSEESFENREDSGLSWFLRFAQNDVVTVFASKKKKLSNVLFFGQGLWYDGCKR